MKFNNSVGKVILRPLLTSKTSNLEINEKKITFYVCKNANKGSIKNAVKALFNANVLFVNIINEKSKLRRFKNREFKTQVYKKAVITLAPNSSINLGGFEI